MRVQKANLDAKGVLDLLPFAQGGFSLGLLLLYPLVAALRPLRATRFAHRVVSLHTRAALPLRGFVAQAKPGSFHEGIIRG